MALSLRDLNFDAYTNAYNTFMARSGMPSRIAVGSDGKYVQVDNNTFDHLATMLNPGGAQQSGQNDSGNANASGTDPSSGTAQAASPSLGAFASDVGKVGGAMASVALGGIPGALGGLALGATIANNKATSTTDIAKSAFGSILSGLGLSKTGDATMDDSGVAADGSIGSGTGVAGGGSLDGGAIGGGAMGGLDAGGPGPADGGGATGASGAASGSGSVDSGGGPAGSSSADSGSGDNGSGGDSGSGDGGDGGGGFSNGGFIARNKYSKGGPVSKSCPKCGYADGGEVDDSEDVKYPDHANMQPQEKDKLVKALGSKEEGFMQHPDGLDKRLQEIERTLDHIKNSNQSGFISRADGGTTDEPAEPVPANVKAAMPASATADDVSAKLSQGEFVLDAATTAYFGVAKLQKMQEQAHTFLARHPDKVQQMMQKEDGSAAPQQTPQAPAQANKPAQPAQAQPQAPMPTQVPPNPNVSPFLNPAKPRPQPGLSTTGPLGTG